MILYRIGEITYKNNSNLVFESQGVGYSLVLPNPSRVEQKQKCKLFIYEIKNDYYQVTYAFKDFKERLLFIDLISLNGIGPKVAFNILNQGWENVSSIIAKGDLENLTKTPYLNPRVAKLIIAELQDKWSKMVDPNKAEKHTSITSNLNEAKETLKMLGFKNQQIETALTKVTTNDVESIIEEAIKLMSNNYESATIAAK